MRKPVYSNKEIADLTEGMGNVFLGLACLILIPYLVAPIFGGKFLSRALIVYSSWIGFALIMKYTSKYARGKIRMKKHKWLIISLLNILFVFIWFPNYIGLIMSVLMVFGFIASYRVQGKTGWQDEQ